MEQPRIINQMLEIDGQLIILSADYSLRWVDVDQAPAQPVLYYKGKRVVKRWSIYLEADVPKDCHGGNANTD